MKNNMIKLLILGLVACFMSGCTTKSSTFGNYAASYFVGTGNDLSYSKETFKKSDATFVGIPTMFGIGFEGTTFPVSPHYSLTALHVTNVTFNKVVAYNAECDIALIKHNNEGRELPVLSDIDFGRMNNKVFTYNPDSIKTYGYSSTTSLPLESSGQIKGHYFSRDPKTGNLCTMMTTNSGGKPGMSGGPVYNSQNEVVGVIIAELFKDISYDPITHKYSVKKVDYTVFAPVQEFGEWLQKALDKTEDKGYLKLQMKNYVPVKMIIQK